MCSCGCWHNQLMSANRRVFRFGFSRFDILLVGVVLCLGGYIVLHSLTGRTDHTYHKAAVSQTRELTSTDAAYIVMMAATVVDTDATTEVENKGVYEDIPRYRSAPFTGVSLASLDRRFESAGNSEIKLLIVATAYNKGKSYILTSQAPDGTRYTINDYRYDGTYSQTCSAPSSAPATDCHNGTW